MAIQQLRTQTLPILAVAEGATTPNPGGSGWAWSSTLSKPVYWTGSVWTGKATGSDASGAVQYNNSGALGGAANVAIHGGDLAMATSSSPTTPSAGTIKTIVKPLTSGGSPRLLAKIPNGDELDLLSPLLHMRQGIATGGQTSITVSGMRTVNLVGTGSGSSLAGSNKLVSAMRTNIASAAVAGSVAGAYLSSVNLLSSNGTGLGGFLIDLAFGPKTMPAIAVSRVFAGVTTNVAAPTNVSPATLTNSIGIGWDAGDANWKLYYGGSVAQTPIDLGANFPVGVNVLMHFTLSSSPAESGVYEYRVLRKTATQTFEAGGILGPLTSVELPPGLTALTWNVWCSNNTDAAAVDIDFHKVVTESY